MFQSINKDKNNKCSLPGLLNYATPPPYCFPFPLQSSGGSSRLPQSSLAKWVCRTSRSSTASHWVTPTSREAWLQHTTHGKTNVFFSLMNYFQNVKWSGRNYRLVDSHPPSLVRFITFLLVNHRYTRDEGELRFHSSSQVVMTSSLRFQGRFAEGECDP